MIPRSLAAPHQEAPTDFRQMIFHIVVQQNLYIRSKVALLISAEHTFDLSANIVCCASIQEHLLTGRPQWQSKFHLWGATELQKLKTVQFEVASAPQRSRLLPAGAWLGIRLENRLVKRRSASSQSQQLQSPVQCGLQTGCLRSASELWSSLCVSAHVTCGVRVE